MHKSLILACAVAALASAREADPTIHNPAISYGEFQKLVVGLHDTNQSHRVSEAEFIEMSRDSGTIILDARTKERYEHIHVKGAVHLALTEFTADSLAKVIPDKNTRILIYCNNNFDNEPVHFAAKTISVSLNVQTFANLHAYGYTNVHELGPLLDVHTTRIPFAGSDVDESGRPRKKDGIRLGNGVNPIPVLPNR